MDIPQPPTRREAGSVLGPSGPSYFRRPCIPSMLRRCRNWDYRGRGIYMITLSLRDRSRPILGSLAIDNDGGGDPEKVEAHIELTPLGSAIHDLWRNLALLALNRLAEEICLRAKALSTQPTS